MNIKTKLIVSITISTILVISTMGLVFIPNFAPNFNYKIPNIAKTIEKTNVNIESCNNYLAIDTDKSLNELENNLKIVENNAKKEQISLDALNVPKGMDDGSMMIFLQNETSKYNLQILDLDLLTDVNSGENGNTKTFKLKITGPNKYMQLFLDSLPNDMGKFNYIKDFKIWKSEDSLSKKGIFKDDTTMFDDEKNVIIEFNIVMSII